MKNKIFKPNFNKKTKFQALVDWNRGVWHCTFRCVSLILYFKKNGSQFTVRKNIDSNCLLNIVVGNSSPTKYVVLISSIGHYLKNIYWSELKINLNFQVKIC